jgi:isopenicillin N synthase-like dioxygenase
MTTKTVDMSSFLDLKGDNISKKKELSIAFLKAFNSKGCISVVGHGIEENIINFAFKTSREFFNCPEEIKRLAYSKDRARRGYSPKLSENLGSLLEINVPNDTVEKFRIGPLLSDKEKESDNAYYDSKEGRLFFFPNTFTGTTPSLESALVTYYNEMEKLSIIILEILELAFNLPESYFKRKMDKHTSILNVNNYYKLEQKDQKRRVTRIAPHMDLSMITITAQTAYQVC